jgi:hypothetical protein
MLASSAPVLAQTGCPQDLGAGIALETETGDLRLEMRPGKAGIVLERRRDSRPDTPPMAAEWVRETYLGIIVGTRLGTPALRFNYDSDVAQLATLPDTGSWTSDTVLEVLHGDGRKDLLAKGSHTVRFLAWVDWQISGCDYRVWHLEHRRVMTPTQPDAPTDDLTYHQWYSPDLGIALEITEPGRDGFPGPQQGLNRISALP